MHSNMHVLIQQMQKEQYLDNDKYCHLSNQKNLTMNRIVLVTIAL